MRGLLSPGEERLRCNELRRLQLGPGAIHLVGAGTIGEVENLMRAERRQFGSVPCLASREHADHTAIRPELSPGVDGVGKAANLPRLLEETRRHAAAKALREDLQGPGIRIRGGEPRAKKDQIGLLKRPVGRQDTPGEAARGRGWGLGGWRHGEIPLGQTQEGVFLNGAGGHDDQAVWRVDPSSPLPQILRPRPGEAGGMAEDASAERMILEGGGLRHLEDQIVRRILSLGDFLEHHPAFPRQIIGIKVRSQEKIGKEGGGAVETLGQGPDLKDRSLVAGLGVDLATA